MYDVIIIGSGVAGGTLVRQLPNGLSALILEQGDEVIPVSCSTANGCDKLHTGMHYLGDQETAEKCLLSSIEFAKEYPNALCSPNDSQAPWRRGRHFILSTSQYSPEEAIKIALFLKERYTQLVDQDPSNKVFGEPENFVQFLEPDAYAYLASHIPVKDLTGETLLAHVALGIETGESQLDIGELRKIFTHDIQQREKTMFLPQTLATHIKNHPNKIGYIVSTKDHNNQSIDYEARALIDCSWQNIESLQRDLKPESIEDETVEMRIKISVEVKLPPELQNMKTCIFSTGPYTSITVRPNGTAILTSEPITNAGHFHAGLEKMPEDIEESLSQLTLEHPEGLGRAKKIREDCANCLNNDLKKRLEEAEILDLHVGFVKMFEKDKKYTPQAIYEKDSIIHARQKDGAKREGFARYSNAAVKLTYGVSNAKKITQWLQTDLEYIQQIDQLIAHIQQMFPQFGENINHFLCTEYRTQLITAVESGEYAQSQEDCLTRIRLELQEMLTQNKLQVSNMSLFEAKEKGNETQKYQYEFK